MERKDAREAVLSEKGTLSLSMCVALLSDLGGCSLNLDWGLQLLTLKTSRISLRKYQGMHENLMKEQHTCSCSKKHLSTKSADV